MLYCPQCKSEYRDGFKTCPDCQAVLVKQLPPEAPVLPQKDRVVVFASTYGFEANMIMSILETTGLNPTIQDEHTIQMQPLYSYAIGGVKVLVPEDKAAEAKTIIQDLLKKKALTNDTEDLSEPEREKVKTSCLKCGGTNISKKMDLDTGLLLIFVLSLIGLLLLPFIHKIHTCMDCGEKWRV